MDYFAIDHPYLCDKIQAICSEIHDKNTLQQQKNKLWRFFFKNQAIDVSSVFVPTASSVGVFIHHIGG